MDTARTPEDQPPKVGNSQRRAPSPLSKGGRRRHSGTKRKRTVRRANVAKLTDRETINALTAPSADIETVRPSEDGEGGDSKSANLSHPKRSLERKEMRRYDVRERLRLKGQVLHASNVAEEQLAAIIPLLGPTAKQRRASLPGLKDQRLVPENMRYSETQTLPVKRETEKIAYDHPQAGKGGSPTWKGGVVSELKLRQIKEGSKVIELKHGGCEGNDIIAHPANPSAHHSSQIVTRVHPNNQNKSNPHPTHPKYFLRNLLPTDREHSENMSNLRGVPPSGRGRNSGRVSRNQQSSNDIEPSFGMSSNISPGGARRPRGFQPTEVNKSAAEQTKNSTQTHPPPEAPAASSALQRDSNALALRESVSSIQAMSTEAVEPKVNPVIVKPLPKSGDDKNSSTQLTNPAETREHKKSCWSKVTSHPEGPAQGWDDSTQDLSQPSWKNREAILATQPRAAVRANMDNLPPYKFPRKKPENPAAESINRQMAGMGKAPVVNLPKSTNSVNASTTMPPHLEGPSHRSQPREVPIKGSKPPNAADKQLPSHLTKSVDTPKITNPRAIDRDEAETGEATIAAMLNYEVPPHLQVTPLRKSRTTEKSKAMTPSSDHHEDNGAQPNVNIDEEVAAGLNAIDRDEELAVALQAELSGGKESTQQDQYHDFETSNHQAHIPQTEKSVGAKNTDQYQNKTSGASNHQESQGEALPPHLRILVTTKSTSQAIGETSNTQVEPMSAQKSGRKSTTIVGTRSEGVKNITNDRAIEQVHTADGGAFATTAKSAVKAGKQPAKTSAVKAGKQPAKLSAVKAGKQPAQNDDLLHGNSDLVNWDGKFAPPLRGEDWADREPFDRSKDARKSLVEAWREDHATEAEVTGGVGIDTKSLEFQTGTGHIGGHGDVLSFIDDADHEAIPNDDNFTQVHREQSAAAAIEQFKAQTASKRKSTKSGESNGTKQPERRDRKRELRDQDEDYDLPSREHAPEANIYLRPAESGDMRQCTDIYNKWAVDTAFTVMLKPVNTAYWTDCYKSSQNDGIPFIVAVHMGQTPCKELKDVRRRKGETIVGFSVATSYGSTDSVYRYSVELELYVDRDHLRKGIGRTMLDRMLAALCQDYKFLDCAPFLLGKDHQLQAWIGGGIPIVHTLAVNLLHWAGEDHENVEWKMKWLAGGRNEFEHVGTIPKIGYKFVKPVNNCLMVRDSGSILSPH